MDEFEVVREVQEYFADFLAVNPELFSLSFSNTLDSRINVFSENSATWDPAGYSRTSGFLIALSIC